MYKEIGVKICIANKTLKVGKYFYLNDLTNHMYQSCLVYKFTCLKYLNNRNVCEIEKQNFVRIKEHITQTNIAVLKHIKNCAFCTNCNYWNNFKITKQCSYYNYLLSTNALLTKKIQPSLNNQISHKKD